MLGGDQYIADRIMAERVKKQMRLAADRHVARQARSSTQKWMVWSQRRSSQRPHILQRWLGRKLSALGRRMQQRGAIPKKAGGQYP